MKNSGTGSAVRGVPELSGENRIITTETPRTPRFSQCLRGEFAWTAHQASHSSSGRCRRVDVFDIYQLGVAFIQVMDHPAQFVTQLRKQGLHWLVREVGGCEHL